MIKKLLFIFISLFISILVVVASLLFYPKHNNGYTIQITPGQNIVQIANQLSHQHIIYNSHILIGATYLLGIHNHLHTGSYRLPSTVSTWEIIQKLRSQRPDKVTIRIREGSTFAQMRHIINQTPDIKHDTLHWTDAEILKKVNPKQSYAHPEGLFFPDSYEMNTGNSDLVIFQAAYQKMQRQLDTIWSTRQANLPYSTPYQLLTMASIIEKETGNSEDRADIASVFINRLKNNMRLQSDPTVIYGMGNSYQGNIKKADLQRSTPYNTYTQSGLPPTPISLPSQASLQAAAQPSNQKYLYFVAKMDGSGKSHFSHTLTEHNAAVRKYILKNSS